jgi:hypothetical protein
MTQSIKATIAGLYAACQTIYASSVDAFGAPVAVAYGPPGVYQPGVIVAVGLTIRQPVTRPTMGSNRSREKTAEIDTVISVYIPGDETQQQAASELASDLSELLEAHFRAAGMETLGGGCRDAWVSSITGPDPSVAVDAKSGDAAGRLATSTVTVTAAIRQ